MAAKPPDIARPGVTRLLAAAAALACWAEAPVYPATDRVLPTDRLYDLLCHALTLTLTLTPPGHGRGHGANAFPGRLAAAAGAEGIDGTRARSLFLPSYQTVLQAAYALFTRVLVLVLPHSTTSSSSAHTSIIASRSPRSSAS